MDLPLEIIEKIVVMLDYKSLRSVVRINNQWRNGVLSLAKRRCLEEIPEEELSEYESRIFGTCNTNAEWAELYDNWYSWKNHRDEIDIEVEEIYLQEDLFIISVAACGDYIGMGLTNDDVLVKHPEGNQTFRLNDGIEKVHFISDEEDNEKPSCLVVVCSSTITHYDLRNEEKIPVTRDFLHHKKGLSIHKSRIAYISLDYRLRIIEIRPDIETNVFEWALVIDTDLEMRRRTNPEMMAVSLMDNVCSVVIHERFLRFHLNVEENERLVFQRALHWCSMNRIIHLSNTWILDDNFIFTSMLSKGEDESTLMQFIDLSDRKRHFYSGFTSNFGSNVIEAMDFHGSTLAAGSTDGLIMFHNVHKWNFLYFYFDCRKFNLPETFGKLTSIAVVGKGLDRVYYVSGEHGVCKFICTTKRLFD